MSNELDKLETHEEVKDYFFNELKLKLGYTKDESVYNDYWLRIEIDSTILADVVMESRKNIK